MHLFKQRCGSVCTFVHESAKDVLPGCPVATLPPPSSTHLIMGASGNTFMHDGNEFVFSFLM